MWFLTQQLSISLLVGRVSWSLAFSSDHPDRIPYRTSYYNRDWVFADSRFDESDKFLVHLEYRSKHKKRATSRESVKSGANPDEILISTYCCIQAWLMITSAASY